MKISVSFGNVVSIAFRSAPSEKAGIFSLIVGFERRKIVVEGGVSSTISRQRRRQRQRFVNFQLIFRLMARRFRIAIVGVVSIMS
uniref:Uncharacterized protein n=1 Tax=Romanomermis culicivorax TaxID=13658 RepID=A0A915L0K2_ROMCU